MGIRIDQAGYPGLDPAAGTKSGVNNDRRVGSSPPATPQLASVEPQMPQTTQMPQTLQTTQMPQMLGGAEAAKTGAAGMENTLEGINKYLKEAGSSLNFIHDEASGRSAVQVVDEHGEVIRQIPPQELLDVYAKIRNIVGILLDESG